MHPRKPRLHEQEKHRAGYGACRCVVQSDSGSGHRAERRLVLSPRPGRSRTGPAAADNITTMTSVSEHSAEPAAQHEIDIHTTAGKLADLRKRSEETLHPVGEAAVEKTHARGKLTARERILALLDEDSFVELDALAKHRSTNFGLQDNRPLGDGVVTGYGTIDGRDVCIFSQDATVFGGSLGEVDGEKIVKVQELAIKTGRPLSGINDGAAARIQEGVVSLGLYSNVNDEDLELDTLSPDSPNQPYDMHEVITRILDDDEFLEVQAGYATNIIVGFGRIEGRPVGIVANQPTQFAGCLDINASEKAARFVRTCDCFNIPIVMLVDVPGFLPGTDQEYNGIIRRGAKLLYA